MPDFTNPNGTPSPHSMHGRFLRGIWAATFYFALPFGGGLGIADLSYDVLGFAFTASLLAAFAFGILAWRVRPKERQIATSWPMYFQQLGVTAALAAAPFLLAAAVFWTLSATTTFPALFPAMLVFGIAFYTVSGPRTKQERNGVEVMRADKQDEQNETLKTAVKRPIEWPVDDGR